MSEKERLIKAIAKKEGELAKLKLQLFAVKKQMSPSSFPPAGECKVRQATAEELAAVKKGR